IVELIDVKRVWNLLREARRHVLVVLRMPLADVAARDANFSAQRLEMQNLLLRHLVGNNQDGPITLRLRHQREPQAGIAGGRLDDRGAWLEPAVAFRRLNHGERNTILDRAGWILVFELNKEPAKSGIEAGNLNQGRIANQAQNTGRGEFGSGSCRGHGCTLAR